MSQTEMPLKAEAGQESGPAPAARPRRVYLVGEHNPYSRDPDDALWPQPEGATGARLARVLGLDDAAYVARFPHRINLLADLPWSVQRARKAADKILEWELEDGDYLILLGAKVATAFGVRFAVATHAIPVQTASIGCWEFPTLVLPHPSGLSRAWNDRTMPERVRTAVETLLADLPMPIPQERRVTVESSEYDKPDQVRE